MEFAIFMINVIINNHPLEKFENDDREMVVILVGACGTKQDVHGIKIFALKKYIVKDQR